MSDRRGAPDPRTPEPRTPEQIARAADARPVRRRFWSEALALETSSGWGVALDGKPLQTPARAALAIPVRAVAEAMAAEWNGAGEAFDPLAMPITRAVNTAIDRVAPNRAAVAAEVAAYGESDLLCYRAEAPEALVSREAAAWDPWLAWMRETWGAPLVCASGVLHVEQPPTSVARLRALVAGRDAFALTPLHEMVALSGSLVLGLAVAEGALDPAEGWAISRVDETWQAEQWGEDAEAAGAAARKAADFAAAARLAALLKAR
ncbi:ATP12 family chaperone protein [Rubrimonas cliftonensis]|uniref:Chaperone required for the assembly of the F1-ATPase n=1 Tax=Rubrimonas cliftonensis TaxID=89524 RepID=A0A1H3VGX0_9RHOB|nr:ATP12 family protein [Rubrimonas cliftonensis]SDZ74045.1 Chaperone required for the assembly of the F1-ATPase [Rubrimonas cliftonensis]